ncbi:hypothetical protein HPULCUR_002457 [Helicostylum pulchrum]|uniref:Uncharacterized protein n=1 Tax=Helicostylum pulchrum TaxID=562976 RepID=A0ABP9XSA8_9FUNG
MKASETAAETFCRYWQGREQEELEERIRKRQRITIESTNDAACSSFDTVVSKIATGIKSCDDEDVENNDDTEDNINDLSFETFDEKVIYLPNDSLRALKLTKATDFSVGNNMGFNKVDLQWGWGPPKTLLKACLVLLKKISDCAPSSKQIRKTITLYIAKIINEFDPIIHDDLDFTDVLCTHFLNMMDSPRNPLQQKQMERNAAFLTTIFIIQNMFLACNDIVDMQWVEKLAGSIGNTKWDGLAFVVDNKTVVPLFVELSGGICFNNTVSKEISDEEKLVKHFINLLEIKKAEGVNNPCQFYKDISVGKGFI